MTKFNVGDKVVPLSKTVDWDTLNRVKDHLDESGTWNRALSNEQTFLYVNRIDKFRNLYICSNECGGGGDYFHESDLTPYKTKPTKNQRITALENEVAELKLIVHELRDGRKTMRDVMNEVLSEPSTTTVEDIIEFEGKQYRKVDRKAKVGDVVIFNSKIYPHNAEPNKPYIVNREISYGVGHHDGETICNVKFAIYDHGRTPENVDVYELIQSKPLTPNQQRFLTIIDAKRFIAERQAVMLFGHVDFIVNTEKRTIVALLKPLGSNQVVKRGIAKCDPNDVFNEHIGKAIALGRALGLDVSEFEQAVQPTKAVNGQLLTFNSGILSTVYEVINVNSNDSLKIIQDDNCKNVGKTAFGDFSENLSPLKIINDTNAIYKEGSN